MSQLCVNGKISESGKYNDLHPHFAKAFEFLKKPDIADLPCGRYDIVEDECWAIVQEIELKPAAERKLEAHRKYIDIQAPLTGKECIGLALMDMAALSLPFDIDKDCVMYDGSSKPMILSPGTFAIFFPPYCAHAPGCIAPNGPEKIKKVVIKVLAE